MSYLDLEKLETIDPAQFQQAKPYPWVNPVGMLTESGYQRLLANLPDISLFEPMFGISALMASGRTTAMFLSTVISWTCSRAGASSSTNSGASVTAGSCGACSAEAESSSTFTGITRRGVVPSRPTATPNENSAPTSSILTRRRTGTRRGAAKP